MAEGYLYSINFPNGKRYIGVTFLSVESRFKRHCKNRHDPDKNYLPVYEALNKFGPDTVEVETLVVAQDKSYLYDLERRVIETFGTQVPAGYNACAGGVVPRDYVFTSTVRSKMRESATIAWRNPTFKAKMSAMRTGKTQSLSTKEKRSARLKEFWADPLNKTAMLAARDKKRGVF